MPGGAGKSPVLSPEEAFSVLGNGTRIQLLRELGAAEGPLTFTQLRDRVGLRQGGRFNYHLDKLVGHFVAKTNAGYELRQAGKRVVEAVLSGAVTEDPVLEPTILDYDCRLCGAPIKLSYRAERVELYCTRCAGQYGPDVKRRESAFDGEGGVLGGYGLPPAGIRGRSPREVLTAASLMGHLHAVAAANGLCPRCGGMVDCTVTVCEDHRRGDGLCPKCNKRHAIQVTRTCRTCPYENAGMAINHVVAALPLRIFVAEQGIDPIVEGYRWGWDYEEDIRQTDPLVADLTFHVDGESITVTVDDELDVVAVTR